MKSDEELKDKDYIDVLDFRDSLEKFKRKAKRQATEEILEKLKIAKECVDFKRITCDTGCKNYLCILNNKFGIKDKGRIKEFQKKLGQELQKIEKLGWNIMSIYVSAGNGCVEVKLMRSNSSIEEENK